MNPISTTIPVQAVATTTDNGTQIKVASLVWSSDNTAVATVDASSGVVTPVGVGSANITATCSGTLPDGNTFSATGAGTVNVTAVGDNITVTIDFQPISVAA